MQRKCHRLYTPIDPARLEKAFEQTGSYKPRKAMSDDWACEDKQQKESYKKGKQK